MRTSAPESLTVISGEPMPAPADTQAAAYATDRLLIQLDPNSNAAEHSRALEAIGGRLLDVIKAGETGGDLINVALGHGITVEKAIQILSHLPGVKFAEDRKSTRLNSSHSQISY